MKYFARLASAVFIGAVFISTVFDIGKPQPAYDVTPGLCFFGLGFMSFLWWLGFISNDNE